MNGHYRWCGWCCNLRYPICCQCGLCRDCCRCPLPSLPYYCPPEKLLDPLPCLGPPPPPTRIIREQVVVPIPYPVYPRSKGSCIPPCWADPVDPYEITQRSIRCSPGAGFNQSERKMPYPIYRCKEPGTVIQDAPVHCPWPNPNKRVHKAGVGIMPGYKGHVPGLRFHAAGRSYGQATRDTCCIMSQWAECCPRLPCRIFEQ